MPLEAQENSGANPCVHVGSVSMGNTHPLVLIAGPCALESRELVFAVASALKEMTSALGMGLIFKTSFDKANRTSHRGKRGIGLEAALPIFSELRETFHIPILTDVHSPEHCHVLSPVVDVLQIPAFLCRQTDLLEAAAHTGRVINIKKGQFLAPWDMIHAVRKVVRAGNPNVLVTERGASFGYNTLVSDFRSLVILAEQTGAPVVFDATHSVQEPGGQGTSSGGARHFVAPLARAAVAVGVSAVFIETHPDPDKAFSDGPNMVPLDQMPSLLATLSNLDRMVKRASTYAHAQSLYETI